MGMTREELTMVEHFTISNSFASVEFLTPVDLTKVDLGDHQVNLSHKSVVIYPNPEDRPEVGVKLNQPARITYKQMACPGNKRPKRYRAKIRKWALRREVEFVSWDEVSETLV